MFHYIITIMYDGTSFKGWQKLPNEPGTIQETIENAILKVIKEHVSLRASGRTDAGVHAYRQFADFTCKNRLPALFLKDCNDALPDTIKITSVTETEKNFHSRKSARQKTYSYHISLNQKPCVFTRKYTYAPFGASVYLNLKEDISDAAINFSSIENAIKQLLGTHDFSAFTSDKSSRDHIRTIYDIKAYITKNAYGGKELVFKFTGDGFLYNMVRILSGTLLVIGLNGAGQSINPQYKYITDDSIENILLAKKRSLAGPTLPPQGLFLENVEY